MERCTKCGQGFVPGSINQKKCGECLSVEIENLTKRLQDLNKTVTGQRNKSVATDKLIA